MFWLTHFSCKLIVTLPLKCSRCIYKHFSFLLAGFQRFLVSYKTQSSVKLLIQPTGLNTQIFTCIKINIHLTSYISLLPIFHTMLNVRSLKKRKPRSPIWVTSGWDLMSFPKLGYSFTKFWTGWSGT